MAHKLANIHNLVVNHAASAWHFGFAVDVLYLMQGEAKPGRAVKEVSQMEANRIRLADPTMEEAEAGKVAATNLKTTLDAIRGCWPSAAVFYDKHLTNTDRDALHEMSEAVARDAIVARVRKHMEVLGKAGRSAYFADIQFASKEEMIAARTAEAARKAAATAAEPEAPEATDTTPAPPAKEADVATVMETAFNLASSLDDAELLELSTRINALMIQRDEVAKAQAAQDKARLDGHTSEEIKIAA